MVAPCVSPRYGRAVKGYEEHGRHVRGSGTRWRPGTGRSSHDQAPGRAGPSAIKARTVASASGLSTMAVYHHFGGIAELIRPVADRGFTELNRTFSEVPVTEDPIADLFAMALMTRRVVRENPHLYDLMFGLSTRRATYRPLPDSDFRSSGRSPAFRGAYVHVAEACARLVSSGRVGQQEPEALAAQLWTSCTVTSPSSWPTTSPTSATRLRRCCAR
jgi:AcrR family transcriptional regulator